jgi:long-chain acyl-CoA synthetase
VTNLASIIDGHPGESPALVSDLGSVTTYEKLRHEVNALRGGLVAAGVAPGDRVALLLDTNWLFVATHLGALGCGAIVVPLNPMSPTAELQRQLDEVSPKVVFVGSIAQRAFDSVNRSQAKIMTVVTQEDVALSDGSVSIDDLFKSEPVPLVERTDDDIAVLMFTSGTAGSPKAAQLTHGNLRSNINMMQSVEVARVTPNDVLLCVIPTSHIYGLNAVLHVGLHAGASVVLVPRFDPVSSLATIARQRVTIVPGVPPMFEAWASLPETDAPPAAFTTVRMALSGASKLDPATNAAFFTRFGLTIGEGYGLTEASPTVTTAVFPHPKVGTIGVPVTGVSIRVVDADGSDVVVGDTGEIWVKGPNVFTGYWNDPDATNRVLTNDGWLKTGDIAVIDASGALTLVDRSKDLIIVSGFNVFPAEVEEALEQHPGIRDAAVVGVAHPHTGETVKAYVVPIADRQLNEDEVIEFCATQLARYKCPTTVMVVPELPRATSGKIIRRDLI